MSDIDMGPAVHFNPDALRAWLAKPISSADSISTGEYLGIDETFSRGDGNMLSFIDDVLADLTDEDKEQTAWCLQPGIERVDFFRTFDGEWADGAIIIVDLDNGVRLASLHQDDKDFADLDSCGVDVVIEALDNIARQANRIVAKYQKP